jgi:hypothetical protein
MDLGDQLTESMMPKRLAGAILMQRVIGEGGGPEDWSKKLYDLPYMRKQMAETGKLVPNMLRPFFDSQMQGLIPGVADTGIYPGPVQTPAKTSPTHVESEAERLLREAAEKQAAATNTLLTDWNTAIQTATTQLSQLAVAIGNAITDLNGIAATIPQGN